MDVFFKPQGLTGLRVEEGQAGSYHQGKEYLLDDDGSQEHNRCPLWSGVYDKIYFNEF